MSSNDWIAIAHKLGPELAEYVARHDEDRTFAAEAFDALKEERLFKALAPKKLGGLVAGYRDICESNGKLKKVEGDGTFSTLGADRFGNRWRYTPRTSRKRMRSQSRSSAA